MNAFDSRGTLYLAIIWHQHQPLYVDTDEDRLGAPWVRSHATKDYYNMAAMLADYPRIHCTINLTSTLLRQLQEYYVHRLEPVIDLSRKKVGVQAFERSVRGKTDPWIDLLMKPTNTFNRRDKFTLVGGTWSALQATDAMLGRFPEYERLVLRCKREGVEELTTRELRELKFWFFLAHFDPTFLVRAVTLPSGHVCDLSDLVDKRQDGRYFLRRPIRESDCRRLLVEVYAVAASIVPIHKALRYDPTDHSGQIELITTPYAHPILPLVVDSDIARECQPDDSLPERFSYPDDATAQLRRSLSYFHHVFGFEPHGMWPAEGAVSHDALVHFAKNGVRWIATDAQILARSSPPGQSHFSPYTFSTDSGDVAIFFRDTFLSDQVGFVYKDMEGEDSSDHFLSYLRQLVPNESQPDRLVTVILDGENAWEWYRKDHGGKQFLHSLYRKLSTSEESREIITVTPTEYLNGNPRRNIRAHSISMLPKLHRLWPGSWINANFNTWIGEAEKNRAWEYLRRTRADLETSGVPRPDPTAHLSMPEAKSRYAYLAWESMYAAEGSDWFWWFGEGYHTPDAKRPFDEAFRKHLRNVYLYSEKSGASMRYPDFPPIVAVDEFMVNSAEKGSLGTMKRGGADKVRVVFRCIAPDDLHAERVCIVGNHGELGGWVPNVVAMSPDTTAASGRWWKLEVSLPRGARVEYKYTYDGIEGQWHPGDEAPGIHRTLVVPDQAEYFVEDVLGKVDRSNQ